MLTENQINLLPERIYERLNGINTEYLKSIGRVLKKIGELRPSDIHKLQQAYDYGADVDRIARDLAKASAKNVAEIYEIFDIVAKENYDYAKPFYKAKGITHIPYNENEKLKTYVQSMAKQTVGEYLNLTQHTAFAIFDKKDGKSIAPLFEANKNKLATSLSDTYTKIVDFAVTKVQLGETSYQSAVHEIVEAMAKSGVRTVDYATGYSKRLDTAVRQNVLWGVKQCNQNVADFVGEEFGADGYEISYHSCPRPKHADMAGKQFAIGKARTINGVYYPSFSEVEHLLEEFNCLHFKFPILLGVSHPAYSKAQLDEFKANDSRTFEFEGETYTLYKGTQLQRDIETAIRHHKDLAIAAKEAGTEDLQMQAQYKINQLTNKYAELSKASGLATKIERMQVKGFRRVKVSNTHEGEVKYKTIVNRRVDEKQFEKYINILGKENMPKTFDLFQDMKYNNTNEWNIIKRKYRIVNQYKVDSGEVPVQTILDMDKAIILEKRNNFPSKYKTSGNIAGAYINDDKKLYLAHSQINDEASKGYKNYKGTSNIVLLQDNRSFNYIDVLMPDGSTRTETFYDTEAKLFEEFHLLLNKKKFSEITMLSERGMCESCKGIMEQFKKAHPNIKINVVSNKKVNSNVWKYRMRK